MISQMNLELLKSSLALMGYVVIPKVLTQEQVSDYRFLFFDWLSRCPVAQSPHAIIKHYNVGHTRFAWGIRTNPSVKQVFEHLWNCDDLIVSFDGCAYHPSTESRKNRYWGHVDQSLLDSEFKCVQGSVALTSNIEACFGCVPGSHLMFDRITDRPPNLHKRWVKVSSYTIDDMVRIPVSEGDMVLWDSRLVHQNFYGAEERLVQFVSYLPRSRADSKNLNKRRSYFLQRRTTTHWPTPVEVVGKQPQVFGDITKLIDYTKLPVEDLTPILPEINKLI
jgi:hypothetical protein